MSPEEFKAARLAFGLSQDEFAKALGVFDRGTVWKWEEGKRAIPGPVAALVEILLNNPSAREGVGLPKKLKV
jgi:DNA-binding transcriptional regulator YiaG